LPPVEKYQQAYNFFADQWSRAKAPVLYVPGCANGVYPCSGTNRQAQNPLTSQFLGPNSATAIGTIVPGTGDFANGMVRPANNHLFEWPALGYAPRFGGAWDVSGNQKIVLRGGVGKFYDRPQIQLQNQTGNPPTVRNVTLQFGQLQNLAAAGVNGVPSVFGFDLRPKLPSSWQWNGGVQWALPWSLAFDASYVGITGDNLFRSRELNPVPLGAALLPQNQDPTLAPSPTAGASALQTNLLRYYQGYGSIQAIVFNGYSRFHSAQFSILRRLRNGWSFGFNETVPLYNHASAPERLDVGPDGRVVVRADQKKADELLGTFLERHSISKANFVWELPQMEVAGGAPQRVLRAVANGWQLSGVWTGLTGAPYGTQNASSAFQTWTANGVTYTYASGGSNLNLTGSPDIAARVRIVGNPGSGCSKDPLRQFNTAAFQGPISGSDGLESGNAYLRGCFESTLDLAIARNIRLPRSQSVQVRLDIFNALNGAGIRNRNANMNLGSPSDPATILNLPFDAQGNVIQSRSQPKNAGFGVATDYQKPRSLQLQMRWAF